MQSLIEVILPVFLVIGAGYGAAWRGWFADSAVDGLMRFAQNFAVPVLLFRSIAGLDLGAHFNANLLLSFYIAAFLSFGAGFAGARLVFNRPLTDSVAIGFCCLFSNSVLLGLPIMERAYGAESLGPSFAIVAIHAPLFYIAGIIAMETARARGTNLAASALARQIGAGIIGNPLVIGIGAGFAVNLTGLALPGTIQAAVDMMAGAAIPAALFGLGGTLVRYRPEGDTRAIAMVVGFSLLLHPALTYGLGHWVFGLSTGELRAAVVTAAMAPGVNTYVFASMYGVGRRIAASSLLIATALSILTVWMWLNLLP